MRRKKIKSLFYIALAALLFVSSFVVAKYASTENVINNLELIVTKGGETKECYLATGLTVWNKLLRATFTRWDENDENIEIIFCNKNQVPRGTDRYGQEGNYGSVKDKGDIDIQIYAHKDKPGNVYKVYIAAETTDNVVINFNADSSWMFALHGNVKNITVASGTTINTSAVTTIRSMFQGCSGITSFDNIITKFDTSNITDMSSMFSGCSNLTSLDLSNFNTNAVENTRKMFQNCSALTTIYVSEKFVTTKVSNNNGRDMFTGCKKLVGGEGTKYDSDHTDKTYAHIDGGEDIPGYFTDINKKTQSSYET